MSATAGSTGSRPAPWSSSAPTTRPGPKLPDGRTAVYTSSIITQVLGGYRPDAREEPIAPHVLSEPLADGARYLICSDGLTDLLERAAIEALLDDDDQASAAALFEAAMAQGGDDNVSLILLRLRRSRLIARADPARCRVLVLDRSHRHRPTTALARRADRRADRLGGRPWPHRARAMWQNCGPLGTDALHSGQRLTCRLSDPAARHGLV